jgi:outer membrane protein TolC
MVWRAAYEGFQGATKERSVAATKTSARVSTNSPDLQNAQARVNDANKRLEVVQDKYNNAAQMAVNIENELIDARKQLQNAQNALRSVQGLPPDEPNKIKTPARRL